MTENEGFFAGRFPKIPNLAAFSGVYLSPCEELSRKNMPDEKPTARAFHRVWGWGVGRMVPVANIGRFLIRDFLALSRGGIVQQPYIYIYIYMGTFTYPP